MIAPFIDPDLEWDFRVPRVASINTSGHKYGQVYPGVGWIIWRDEEGLPDDLVFKVNYLGGEMPTFALNFSRPGAQVVAQYYEFIRLGREGFTAVQQAARDAAMRLRRRSRSCRSSSSSPTAASCRCSRSRPRTTSKRFDVFDVSRRLRERGWHVPAYSFPKNREDLASLRVVVRDGNIDLHGPAARRPHAPRPELEKQIEPLEKEVKETFHHGTAPWRDAERQVGPPNAAMPYPPVRPVGPTCPGRVSNPHVP